LLLDSMGSTYRMNTFALLRDFLKISLNGRHGIVQDTKKQVLASYAKVCDKEMKLENLNVYNRFLNKPTTRIVVFSFSTMSKNSSGQQTLMKQLRRSWYAFNLFYVLKRDRLSEKGGVERLVPREGSAGKARRHPITCGQSIHQIPRACRQHVCS